MAQEISDLPEERFQELLHIVSELQARVARFGVPSDNPFFGCRLLILLATDNPRILSEIDKALQSARRSEELDNEAAVTLNLQQVSTLEDCGRLSAALRWLAASPDFTGANLSDAGWLACVEDLHDVITAGQTIKSLVAKSKEVIRSEAYSCDVNDICRSISAFGNKWYGFWFRELRSANKRLAGLCKGKPPRTIEQKLELLNEIVAVQQATRSIDDQNDVCGRLFGLMWRGLDSDWIVLENLRAFIAETIHESAGGVLPKGLLDHLGSEINRADLGSRAEAIDHELNGHNSSWTAVIDALDPDLDRMSGEADPGDLAWRIQVLERWRNIDKLQEMVSLNQARKACVDRGLFSVCLLADYWPDAGKALCDGFILARAEGILRMAIQDRPILGGFDRASHEDVVDKFRTADKAMQSLNQNSVKQRHRSRRPRQAGVGAMGTLLGQMGRKRNVMPIRQLMQAAGEPIQAIKPVFMMSPLSIAQFIPPGGPRFDMVIFDEASQIRPEDALGAILRANQMAVVGDSMQMPPTNFFMRLQSGDDDGPSDTDSDVVDYAVPVGDMESILTMAKARGVPSLPLRWHYRSRHHSLIAVSNHLFYDSQFGRFP